MGADGSDHIRLAGADRDVVTGALHTAWKLRVEKNAAAKARGAGRQPRRKA